MIELTRDESLAILEELSKLPYRDVQQLIILMVNKLSSVPEVEEPLFAPEPIYTGA